MYAALLNNVLVLAVDEAQKQQNKNLSQKYFCPHCQREVQLIIKKERSYFKHLAQVINMSGENREHALSKELLYTALRKTHFDAQMEASLANGQLRADILASPKLAFEIQCAPLNKSEFRHRHLLYRHLGVKDIWIVGKRHYLEQNLKKSQLIFFRNNQAWQDYYLEINPQQKILRLKYNVLLEPVTNKLHYQIQVFNLNPVGLRNLWHFQPNLQKYQINAQKQKEYLQLQLAQKSLKGMQIAEKLYKKRQTIEDLPSWVFQNFRAVNTCDNVTKYLNQT